MDIKAKVEEIVEKLKGDKTLLSKFQADPIATLEGLLGVDLPDEQLKALADGVKAKLGADRVGDALGGLKGLLGK